MGKVEAESEIPNTTTGPALYKSLFSGQSPSSGGWNLGLDECRGGCDVPQGRGGSVADGLDSRSSVALADHEGWAGGVKSGLDLLNVK